MPTPEPIRTVPIAANGLEGWTSCCEASVTYSEDGALCCKKCWHEVEPVEPIDLAARRELGEVIEAVIVRDADVHEAIRKQRALLKWDVGVVRVEHGPAAIIRLPE